MNNSIKKVTKEKRILVMGVRITETLDLYPVGHEDYILFKDAKPNSIRQAARKLLPKTFDVSELGQVDRTIIKRIS